jgi:hypothetical protein
MSSFVTGSRWKMVDSYGLSKLTARSKPIAAFDDAANQHCTLYLSALLVCATSMRL